MATKAKTMLYLSVKIYILTWGSVGIIGLSPIRGTALFNISGLVSFSALEAAAWF